MTDSLKIHTVEIDHRMMEHLSTIDHILAALLPTLHSIPAQNWKTVRGHQNMAPNVMHILPAVTDLPQDVSRNPKHIKLVMDFPLETHGKIVVLGYGSPFYPRIGHAVLTLGLDNKWKVIHSSQLIKFKLLNFAPAQAKQNAA